MILVAQFHTPEFTIALPYTGWPNYLKAEAKRLGFHGPVIVTQFSLVARGDRIIEGEYRISNRMECHV